MYVTRFLDIMIFGFSSKPPWVQRQIYLLGDSVTVTVVYRVPGPRPCRVGLTRRFCRRGRHRERAQARRWQPSRILSPRRRAL
jgi:hypothetical protein